ncbi:nonribosomal peptide synthase [Aspergillus ustus]|uniref:Nonribosomal peptide synthase n=1 Tax=Aspergillus ustus TaxID=40382 RepID=A0A0C1E320_ASPUT|nr:nonribosomal peptide synthase [Aspergillus ustus]
MVPALFIPVEYLPLSASSKVNRRLLKEKASLLSRQRLDVYRSSTTRHRAKVLPSTQVELTIQKLMSEALHLDKNDIGMNDHFFHLGGDSISAMAIASQARRAGLKLGMADILSNPRLSSLATIASVEVKQGGNEHDISRVNGPFSLISLRSNYEEIVKATMEQCGLERETSRIYIHPDEYVLRLVQGALLSVLDLLGAVQCVYDRFTKQSAALSRRKRVFLTGATGLLGSQTLRQLLDDPSVDRVIVHVRAANPAEALERVGYGLINGGCYAITDIIHNGATVRWQAPYQTLKAVNVDSVADLLSAFDQWDQSSGGSFKFVSSGLQRAPGQDMAAFRKVVEQSNGYSQIKFVAEQLVSMYKNRQPKQSISIFRPGLIIGTEEEGIPNVDDFKWRLVQVCLRMGAYPMDDEGHRWISVADVQEVATALLASAFDTPGLHQSEANFSATSPPHVEIDIETGCTVSEFWSEVQDTVNTKLTPINPESWKQAAECYLADDPFRPLLAIVQESRRGFGVQMPAGNAISRVRPGVIRKNVETLVDIGFLRVARQKTENKDKAINPTYLNGPTETKPMNPAVFSRSRQ